MFHQLLILTRSSIAAVHRTTIADKSSTDVSIMHWKLVVEEGFG